MSLGLRLLLGRCLNVLIAVPAISWLANRLMVWAEALTGDPFGWPQIAFMSAYPDHIRNGYLLFTAAVLAYVLFSSGLLTLMTGASPGKALFGVALVDQAGRSPPKKLLWKRLFLILLIVSFILFAGPALGFIFGPVADPWSLAALALGLGIAAFALLPSPTRHTSRIDRRLGLEPALRTSISTDH